MVKESKAAEGHEPAPTRPGEAQQTKVSENDNNHSPPRPRALAGRGEGAASPREVC
jgi:hypothetical protein